VQVGENLERLFVVINAAEEAIAQQRCVANQLRYTAPLTPSKS